MCKHSLGLMTLTVASTIMMSGTICCGVYGQESTEFNQTRLKLQADWKKLREFDESSKSYDISKQTTDKDEAQPEKPPIVLSSKIRVSLDLPAMKRMFIGKRENIDIVYARNHLYAFLASKKANSGWTLNRQDARPMTKNEIDTFADTESKAFYPLSSNHWHELYSTMLNKPEFEIKSVEKLGTDKLKLHFHYVHIIEYAKKRIEENGYLILNTTRHSVVEECNTNICHEVRSIDEGAAGNITCRSIKHNIRQGLQVITYEYANYDYKPSNDDQFWLKHYGLPEPVVSNEVASTSPTNAITVPPPEKRTNNSTWLFGSAVIFAFIALLCGWLSRRYKPA